MRIRRPNPWIVAMALAALGLPAAAQFKVVEPDGRVTYTDRPPSPSSGARVTAVRRDGSAPAAAGVPLPPELRRVAARFPVTLYAAADCAPCDSARRLLQSRGVPHAEKLVTDDADSEALLRLTGGRTLPTLQVGMQVLRGYAGADWQSTLDLAGYPRESKLPRGWVAPEPTPLVARAAEPKAPAEPQPVPALPPEAPDAAASAPPIRF